MAVDGRGWKRWPVSLAGAVRNGLRWPRLLAGSLLAAGLAATPGQAQEVAPAHWVDYAHAAGGALQSRLSDGAGELVTRLHERLSRQAQAGAARTVLVQLWISGHGNVERSQFDSFGDVQADADLRALLAARPLPAPPADMRQPLVLRLTLQANPEPTATGSGQEP